MNFGDSRVTVVLSAKDGRKTERQIFSRYGHARTRTVQEICDAIGGYVIYFRFGRARTVVPVWNWRGYHMSTGSDDSTSLSGVALAIVEAIKNGQPVTAMGESRVEWKISSLTSRKMRAGESTIDEEADSSPGTPGPVDATAMKEDFR